MRLAALLVAAAFLVNPAAASVENVTLEMNFNLSGSDDVYFDGSTVGRGSFSSGEPYLVSESGSAAGIVSRSFIEVSRELDTRNRLVMIREPGPGSFLLPFTRSFTDVRDDVSDVKLGVFMSQVSPSFGYAELDERVVKVVLQRGFTAESGTVAGNSGHITVKNRDGSPHLFLE